MIALQKHDLCGLDGSGDVERDLSARCTVARKWSDGGHKEDRPGCGKWSRVCPDCGVRAIMGTDPCTACATDPGGLSLR